MTKHLMINLLISLPLCAMNEVKDINTVETQSTPTADQINRSQRKLNSLVEAFMQGKLQAEAPASENKLNYPDYADATTKYIIPVQEASEALTSLYTTATYAMQDGTPLKFQTEMKGMNAGQKKKYLQDLNEGQKIQLQMLRFYDFQTNSNFFVPENIKNELNSLYCNPALSEEQKGKQAEEITKSFDIKKLEENRQALKTAMKNADVEAITAACSKPLQVTFVSLEEDIKKMISDAGSLAESRNTLLNNRSRTDCIIS